MLMEMCLSSTLAHLCRLEGERRTAVDEVNSCYVYGKGSRMKWLEKLFGSFFFVLCMAAGFSCNDDIVMSFVVHARQWKNQENLLKHIRMRHTMILRMEFLTQFRTECAIFSATVEVSKALQDAKSAFQQDVEELVFDSNTDVIYGVSKFSQVDCGAA